MEKPYQIGSSPDRTYIYARKFQQPYTAELAQTLMAKLVRLGENLGILGCLIDIRGTKSVSSVSDKYEFAYNKAPAASLPHLWRYAFLVDQGDDSPNFVETVMINAGYMFQIFDDELEAVKWLKAAQSR